jgi:hypothetical protein
MCTAVPQTAYGKYEARRTSRRGTTENMRFFEPHICVLQYRKCEVLRASRICTAVLCTENVRLEEPHGCVLQYCVPKMRGSSSLTFSLLSHGKRYATGGENVRFFKIQASHSPCCVVCDRQTECEVLRASHSPCCVVCDRQTEYEVPRTSYSFSCCGRWYTRGGNVRFFEPHILSTTLRETVNDR